MLQSEGSSFEIEKAIQLFPVYRKLVESIIFTINIIFYAQYLIVIKRYVVITSNNYF